MIAEERLMTSGRLWKTVGDVVKGSVFKTIVNKILINKEIISKTFM